MANVYEMAGGGCGGGEPGAGRGWMGGGGNGQLMWRSL